jgi:hypothetical protein
VTDALLGGGSGVCRFGKVGGLSDFHSLRDFQNLTDDAFHELRAKYFIPADLVAEMQRTKKGPFVKEGNEVEELPDRRAS